MSGRSSMGRVLDCLSGGTGSRPVVRSILMYVLGVVNEALKNRKVFVPL